MTPHDNISYFVCDGTNNYYLSKLCVNGSYEETLCIPELDRQLPYRVALGVWGLIVMVFGVIGNLLTLLSIPYAAQKQR